MGTEYMLFIRSLREKRGLSQLVVAEKLGLSRSSYIAVEQGKRELTHGEFKKLAEVLGVSLEDMERGELPDYDKYKQMILAFLRFYRDDGVTKTKLAKLLYFADFSWFYKHLESMSGMQYRKIKYGPVADTYFRLIDEMVDSGEINIKQKGEAMIVSLAAGGTRAKLSKLSVAELRLMEKINKKWQNKRTAEIVKFTHNQLPYMFAEDNEIVSYEVFGQEDPDEIY